MNREEYILTGDEEYLDVYDQYEYLAAQELAEYDGALVETEDGCKASVWLSEEEVEVVLQLAEARDIPPRHLIQEWVTERIKEAAKLEI
ncbi:MAG: hypothetical protein OXI43_21425 [Candidatus Poribacteria bacterium]|nr:hypothetical protein [Candidatus Poribacteria bacterium]